MKKDYSDVLNKIKISLYIMIALLVVNIALNVINTNVSSRTYASISGSGSKDENNEGDEIEYDVSSFKALNYKELTEEVKSEDYRVVYIGRSTCGYCAKFLPMMKQGQEEYGFTTQYFDITQVIDFVNNKIIDQDAYDGLIAIDDFFKENFGATPMVAVFKNGEFVKGTVGYTDYATYASFLEEAGLEKK